MLQIVPNVIQMAQTFADDRGAGNMNVSHVEFNQIPDCGLIVLLNEDGVNPVIKVILTCERSHQMDPATMQ